MIDRELLELAAKALGAIYDYGTDCISHNGGIDYEEWNPLEDDGDAFRLAAKLTMDVDILLNKTRVYADHYGENLRIVQTAANHTNCNLEDTTRAARRAIVRAAAEVGRRL